MAGQGIILCSSQHSLSNNSAGSRVVFVYGNPRSLGVAPAGGERFAPRNSSGGPLDPSRTVGPIVGLCDFADPPVATRPEERDPKKVFARDCHLLSRKKAADQSIPWEYTENLRGNARRHERPTEEQAPKGFVRAAGRSKLSYNESTMVGNDGGVWIDHENLGSDKREIVPVVSEAPRRWNNITIDSSLFLGLPTAIWKSVERLVGSFIGIAPGNSPLAASSGREKDFLGGQERSVSSSETNDDEEEESSSGPTGAGDDALDDEPIATKSHYVRCHQRSNIILGSSLSFQSPQFEAYNRVVNDRYEVPAPDEVDPSQWSRRTTTPRCPTGWPVRRYNNPVGVTTESLVTSRATAKERRRQSLKPPADVLAALERMKRQRRIRKERDCGGGLAVLP